MNYLLVQNKQIVHLGPINWRQRFIQTEINDLVDAGELTIEYSVPATEQGYIDIGEGFEIFPVELTTPSVDYTYQHLAGPVYTYDTNTATGTYTPYDLDIDSVKSNLKAIAAAERYRKQTLGTTVTIAGINFFVQTDKDTINQYISLATSTGNNTINYKSPTGFISVTGEDIQNIANQINDYIQEQFNWELNINNQIDSINDITTLQSLVIVEPFTPLTPGGLINNA